MKKVLIPLTLFVAASAAYAGSNVGTPIAASDPATMQTQNAAMTNVMLARLIETDGQILAALKRIEGQQTAHAPGVSLPGSPPPLDPHAPAVVYRLTGATGEPWAPEGVWADETGIHARFKIPAHSMAPLSVADSILVEQSDGTYQPVGLRFWPAGIVDVEARSNHIVFRKGNQEVKAAAIEH